MRMSWVQVPSTAPNLLLYFQLSVIFGSMSKVTGGSQWTNSYGKKHYDLNKQKYIDGALARKTRNIEFLDEYRKTQICADCGNDDHRVLDFDHIKEKRGCVGFLARSGVSIKTLQEEIAKCEVRCANCHRIRHYEERDSTI